MRTIHISKECIEKETSLQGVEFLIPGFLLDRESELILLKKAVVAKDYKKICSLAHNWKGFCSPYGFNGLAMLSEQLESTSDREDIESVKNIVGKIEFYLKVKREVLSLN